MSEIIHDSHVELESLSRRFLEEQRAYKKAKDAVASIKEDIQKILGSSRFVETQQFTIEVKEVEQKRMMGKDEFIRKYSPPMKDSQGNIMLNPDNEPILDIDVGKKFYKEHLVDRSSNRFYVKKKPV